MNAAIAKLLAPHPPGVFAGIENSAYHRMPGLSRSQLVVMDDSPAEFLNALEHPEERKETSAMAIGTICDHMVFAGNEELPRGYREIPDTLNLRTNEAKAIKAAFPDDVLVRHADIETARACARSILRRSIATKVFANGRAQLSCFAPITVDGVTLTRRCRPDWLPDGANFIVDLKTSRFRPTTWGWASEIESWGYATQAAYYLDILRDLGQPFDLFCHAVVQTSPPYRVKMFKLSAQHIADGRADYLRMLTALVACIKTDDFTKDDSETIAEVEKPTWARR